MASAQAVSRSIESPHPFNEAVLNRIQAAFEVQHRGQLLYSGRHNQRNLYHLTRMVAKQPSCLHTHVRRVYLSIDCHNRPALIGALVDLFLVLRGRGATLYFRLLETSASLLGSYLTRSIDRAFRSNDVARAMRLPLEHSVLANGKDGAIFRL